MALSKTVLYSQCGSHTMDFGFKILDSRFSASRTWIEKQQTNGIEIERFDWFMERIQTRVAFGWLRERSGEKTSCRRTSRNQSILWFDVILQNYWPIEQSHLHIRVFFGGKTKSPCFDLFIHWLIKQITNTYRNHFSRSYGNRFKKKNYD